MDGNARYGIFADMGLGKTASFLYHLKTTGKKALVVCPLTIIRQAWLADNEKFGFGLSICNLHEVLSKKKAIPEAQVYLINYERIAKRKGRKTIVNPQIDSLGIDCLIIDESSHMKNPKSQQTQALLQLASHTDSVYLASGSPAPNSPMEYWAQMNAIDPAILGDNYFVFRNTYFYRPAPEKNAWLWVPNPGSVSSIMDKVKTKALFLEKEDWLDLPDKEFILREVPMSRDWVIAYETMRKHQVLEFQDVESIAPHDFTKILRLREITAGFIRDGQHCAWISKGKLNALDELVQEIKGQVMIWTVFTDELKAICDKYKIEGVFGGQKQEDRERIINNFKAGKSRILVANMGTISHGVTLVNCSNVVYYSLTYSYEQYTQSLDRFHRLGQKKSVNYFHLICPNTVDAALYQVLQRKDNVMNFALDFLRISPKSS